MIPLVFVVLSPFGLPFVLTFRYYKQVAKSAMPGQETYRNVNLAFRCTCLKSIFKCLFIYELFLKPRLSFDLFNDDGVDICTITTTGSRRHSFTDLCMPMLIHVPANLITMPACFSTGFSSHLFQHF